MVTVCKFFLTNSCRYGDNCRFSHVISDRSNSNPYIYDARYKQEGGVSIMQRFNNSNSTPKVKDDISKMMPEYLKRIEEDVSLPQQQGMWPLTCYSFLKTQGNLPDWNDVSMEECRWEAYQAQANGTMPVYIARMDELLAHARQVRSIYLKPNSQIEAIMKNYVQNTDGITTASNQDNLIFMNSTPSETQKNFSFQKAFNQSQPLVGSSNSATGIFAKAAQSLANRNSQQNTFFGGNSSNNTFFGGNSFQIPQISNNVFGGNSTSSPQHQTFFSGNTFNSSDNKFQLNNNNALFNQGNTLNKQSAIDEILYSKVNELSTEDHDAFKATTFTPENLPFSLPPKELC